MSEVDHYCKWCKHFGTKAVKTDGEQSEGFAMCQIIPRILVHSSDYCLKFEPTEYAKKHLDKMKGGQR